MYKITTPAGKEYTPPKGTCWKNIEAVFLQLVRKHFYPSIGGLESPGEEFDCAQVIDSLPQVKYWVRNMPNQPSASFWLPTSTDRFYPDFVAELNDGRIFVVEYKGKPYVTNDDSKEKRNLGELWVARLTVGLL